MPRGRKKAVSAAEEVIDQNEKTVNAAETNAEAASDEIASAPKRRGRKPAAKKADSAAAESAAANEETASSEDKSAEAPKKRGRKSAAETAGPLSYDKIVEAVRTKASSSSAKFDFAAQISLFGDFEGLNPNGGKEFFIKCTGGNIDVQPYNYGGADIEASADAAALMQMIAGKLTLSDAVEQGKAEMNKLNSVTIALKNIIS